MVEQMKENEKISLEINEQFFLNVLKRYKESHFDYNYEKFISLVIYYLDKGIFNLKE